MKKKIITTIFILIAIILLNILIPKNVQAAKKEDSFFSDDITYDWIFEEEGDVMAYGLFIPSTAEDFEMLPMIVHLHGWAGVTPSEDGLRTTGLPGCLETWELENFSAYVLCPCLDGYDGSWRASGVPEMLKSLLDKIIGQYNIDAENIVISGESRGGTGALYIADYMPEYFSKCVVFSPFYTGPFNTSMDTLCFYSWYADDASKYARYLVSAFGADRVFTCGSGHGSVGHSFMYNDGDELARSAE